MAKSKVKEIEEKEIEEVEEIEEEENEEEDSARIFGKGSALKSSEFKNFSDKELTFAIKYHEDTHDVELKEIKRLQDSIAESSETCLKFVNEKQKRLRKMI